jgi:hypothetical protein
MRLHQLLQHLSARPRLLIDAAATAAAVQQLNHLLQLYLQLLGSLLSAQTITLTGIFGVALLYHVAEFPAMLQLGNAHHHHHRQQPQCTAPVELTHVAQQSGLHEIKQRP